MKKTLKTKLFFSCGLMVFLSILFVSLPVIFFETAMLKSDLHRDIELKTLASKNGITSFFDMPKRILRDMEIYVTSGNLEKTSCQDSFAHVIEGNPSLYCMYYVDMLPISEGGFFYSSDKWEAGNDYDKYAKDWFNFAIKSQEPIITEPYVDADTGQLVSTVSYAVRRNGEVEGVLAIDIMLTSLEKIIGSNTVSAKGESFLLDSNGKYLTHKDQSKILSANFFEEHGFSSYKKNISQKSFVKLSAGKGNYLVECLISEETGWVFVSTGKTSEIFSDIYRSIRIILIIAFVCMIVVVAASGIISSNLLRPLRVIRDEISVNVDEIAAGRTGSKKIDVVSSDEIGDVAAGFNTFIEKLGETLGKIHSAKEKECRLGEQLFNEAQNLVVSAKETSATSQDSSAAVKQIVSTMEDSNDLSENISKKIKEVSDVAGSTSSDVIDGVAQIELNVAQLHEIFDANQQTIDGIKNLSEKIENIWDIVSLINNVADQAKIIAFNAELEASSAGEAGKSFRIVANEIRRLSDGIIDGTHEIKERIGEIQHSSDLLIQASESSTEKINIGYDNARDLGNKFESIKKSSEVTAKKSEEISSIIQQQASASEQILMAIKEIAAGVENFTVATDNITNAAENVRKISEDLNNASHEE